jgi:hypothetical protein
MALDRSGTSLCGNNKHLQRTSMLIAGADKGPTPSGYPPERCAA